MITAYWLVMVLLACYFGVRRFDIFALAYFSSCLYFLPAAFPQQVISAGAYAIYITVLVCIFGASLLNAGLPRAPKTAVAFPPPRIRIYLRGVFVLYACLIAAYAGEMVGGFSAVDKGDGGGLVYYALSAVLGYMFILGLLLRSKAVTLLCLANYAFFVITGDRTQLVIAIFAAALFYASGSKESVASAVRKLKAVHLLGFSLVVIVGLFGKSLYGAHFDANRGGDFSAALKSRVVSGLGTPSTYFESYHVQAILNYAIDGGDRIEASYLLWVPVQMLPFSGLMGSDVHSQSSAVKSLYFSDWSAGAGVSSNFFAEGFLLWGYAGAIAFALLYAGILVPMSRFISGGGLMARIGMCFGAAFWAFYIHRSSLFQIIAHEKRILYSMILVIVFARLLHTVARMRSKRVPAR